MFSSNFQKLKANIYVSIYRKLQKDDNGTLPVFKIWNLTKASNVNGGISMPCVRTEKIILQKPTAIAVSENGHYFAIGFDRGTISLYRGDISRDRTKNLKTISTGSTAITGIAFKQQGKTVQMFVCSDSGVIVFNLQHKDREVKAVLDKTVAPTRCCAIQTAHGTSETHFMVGRDDVSLYILFGTFLSTGHFIWEVFMENCLLFL